MDQEILAAERIVPPDIRIGFVVDYRLCIGERATLVRSPDSRAYGVVMDISSSDVTRLYSEPSVRDYVSEPVTVTLEDGSALEASCYNLPADKITGINPDYAKLLLALATRLGFPESYLNQIRQF